MEEPLSFTPLLDLIFLCPTLFPSNSATSRKLNKKNLSRIYSENANVIFKFCFRWSRRRLSLRFLKTRQQHSCMSMEFDMIQCTMIFFRFLVKFILVFGNSIPPNLRSPLITFQAELKKKRRRTSNFGSASAAKLYVIIKNIKIGKKRV